MAALKLTRTTISNISKSNITSLTSLSFSQKVSRLCFTSASKHSQGKCEETNNGYDGDEAISYSSGKRSEDATNKMEEGKDRIKEGAGEMKDIPMDGMKEANEKIKEKVSHMKDKAKAKTKQTVGGAWDAVKDTSQNIKESVVGTSDDDDDGDRRFDEDRRGKPKVKDEGQII